MPASTEPKATAAALGADDLPKPPCHTTEPTAAYATPAVTSPSAAQQYSGLSVPLQLGAHAAAASGSAAMQSGSAAVQSSSAAVQSSSAAAHQGCTATAAATPPATSFLDLPIGCQDLIIQQLPPNSIPLCIRKLSKELRQRYLHHTTVQAADSSYLPIWAVLAELPHMSIYQQQKLMAALARRGDLEGMQQLAQQPWVPVNVHSTHASSSQLSASSHPHACSRLWVNEMTLLAAAAYGHLHIVRWLVEEHCFGPSENVTSISTAAALGGHLHVLKYLRCHQPEPFPWDSTTCAAAARGGHLHTLQWLRSNVCPWDRLTMFKAAEHGHLHILSWAHEQGCPFDPMCCNTAAVNGHMNVLQYLFQQGYTTGSSDLSAAAAYGGQQGVLQWLREQEHSWTVAACTNAARQGNCKLLRWLREQEPPCPWDKGVTRAAALSLAPGAPSCLEYALSNCCAWDDDVHHLVMSTPRFRHVRFPPGVGSDGEQAGQEH